MPFVSDTASSTLTMPVQLRVRPIVTLVLALLFLVVPGLAGPAATEVLKVGDVAPDFTLPATTGGDISLSQFRGKKAVLLEFYAADFSPV
jgi:hypothetical protein